MSKKQRKIIDKLTIKNKIKNLGVTATDIWTETINLKTGLYFGERNKNGKPHGGGSIEWENDQWKFIYIGNFDNGQFSGDGILSKESKKNRKIKYIYGGKFLNDKIKKGTCSFMFEDKIQAVFEGKFKNNECHGEGYLIFEDNNKKIKCNFVNGKPKNNIKIKNFFI